MKKSDVRHGNFQYILKLALEPKLWFVIFIPIFSFVIGQKAVASSWLTAQIFNKLQLALERGSNVSLLYSAILYATLIFGLDIVQWLLSTVSDLIENYWREHINVKLQNQFMLKDYKSNAADYDNPALINRRAVAKNVDPVGVIKLIINFISTLFTTISFSIILWNFSPIMVIIAIVIKLPTYYFYDKTMKFNRKFKINSGTLIREKKYYYGIPVNKASAKEYKIFNMKEYVCDKYDEVRSRYLVFYRRSFTKTATNNSILRHYDGLITIVVEIVIGISVFTGKMLFGQYSLFVASFNNVAGSMEKIIDFVSQYKDNHKQNTMMMEYLNNGNIYEAGEHFSREVAGVTHTIKLINVSFSYPGTDKKILHGLNMTISAGKTYGLVGLNGSGKSTFVNLLLRLYEPDEGEILLDGVNIQAYNIDSYYESIACVFQNVAKYAMSIKDYVASGKSCDLERAKAALHQVKLTDWCHELPYGLDTMLTRAFTSESSSVEPSTGQWQKLSIARAIYKNPPIMILDEPSASLDVDSENEIFNYIAGLTVKKTAILISHRLSNIIECDHIFVLQEGHLVEQGSHHDLMEIEGVYANLFHSQAKYYKTK